MSREAKSKEKQRGAFTVPLTQYSIELGLRSVVLFTVSTRRILKYSFFLLSLTLPALVQQESFSTLQQDHGKGGTTLPQDHDKGGAILRGSILNRGEHRHDGEKIIGGLLPLSSSFLSSS